MQNPNKKVGGLKLTYLLLRLLSLFSKNLLCSYQRDPSGVLRCQGTDLALIS